MQETVTGKECLQGDELHVYSVEIAKWLMHMPHNWEVKGSNPQTNKAGWLATSQLINGTDFCPAGHLALGTGIWGNGLCKLMCQIPAGPFKKGMTV